MSDAIRLDVDNEIVLRSKSKEASDFTLDDSEIEN